MKQKLQNFLNSHNYILFKEYGHHKTFHNKEGEYHRLDGPAMEWSSGENGTKEWCLNGKRHRLDGPAMEWEDGTKQWFFDDKLHRLDGPACEYSNGGKEWYVNGKEHRLDGPTLEYIDGSKFWYVDGIEINKEDYPKAVKQYLLKLDKKHRSN